MKVVIAIDSFRGLGYAFVTFLNGVLEPGIDIIIKETNLEDTIKDADFAVLDKPMTLENAMDKKEAAKNMTNTTEQLFRLIHQCQQRS